MSHRQPIAASLALALATLLTSGCESVAPAALEAFTPVAVEAVNRYFDSLNDPPEDTPPQQEDPNVGSDPVDYESGGGSPSPGAPSPPPSYKRSSSCESGLKSAMSFAQSARDSEAAALKSVQLAAAAEAPTRLQTGLSSQSRILAAQGSRIQAGESAKALAKQKALARARLSSARVYYAKAVDARNSAWTQLKRCEQETSKASSACKTSYSRGQSIVRKELQEYESKLRQSGSTSLSSPSNTVSYQVPLKAVKGLKLAASKLSSCPLLPKSVVVVTRSAGSYAVRTRAAEPSLFDCREVTDEFDEILFGPVLENPGAYVPTIGGKIDLAGFESSQKGKLTLREGREDMGIALLRTSEGKAAKFLFAWVEGDDAPSLLIESATLIEEGVARTRERLALAPGEAIDLDASPDVEQVADDGVDLGYRIADDGSPILEALNSAAAEFPSQSFCAPPYPGTEEGSTE
jgi:hypothetical protein